MSSELNNVDLENRNLNANLVAFLGCTLRSDTAIATLRGHHHLLRLIWSLVCEEWWELHIERFPHICNGRNRRIPELRRWHKKPRSEYEYGDRIYPAERTLCSGCPVAVVERNITFPDPVSLPPGTYAGQRSQYLQVNMMPFNVYEIDSLPLWCQQYWPMIRHCGRLISQDEGTAYLTIDEHPVTPGCSQRRQGLHVESPGTLPSLAHWQHEKGGPQQEAYDGNTVNAAPLACRYVPGQEHNWGRGLMMRNERVEGGIFMASNVANTTAVWNCQIRDENGDFIGPHGDIERFRELLGPCARTLDVGELVWMTDRTPHESLPVPVQADGSPARRQYFRLVVGTVTAWYAEHSTPNPLGHALPSTVRVVRGNKHTIYPKKPFNWSCGDPTAIQAAHRRQQMRIALCEAGAGHAYERFLAGGVCTIESLLNFETQTTPEASRDFHHLCAISRKVREKALQL